MLIEITTASPPYEVPQAKATEFMKSRMAVRPAIARLIEAASQHSGIDTRYVVVPDGELQPLQKFYSTDQGSVIPDTKERMNQYEHWAKVLTKEAVARLLEKTQCDPSSIRRLITISCTGFFA
ncbi:MAG: hypothetical protein KGJ59_14290, partial [Bacteroidota bacterium]|nr:hypothetical protein [Bacteroidota bacterium]